MKLGLILKPKSEEEILQQLSSLTPDDMLDRCVTADYLPGVIIALENGASINNIRYLSRSLLKKSIENGNIEIVECLIEYGAKFCYNELEACLKNPDLLGKMIENYNPAQLTIIELKDLFYYAKRHYLYRSAKIIRSKLIKEIKEIIII